MIYDVDYFIKKFTAIPEEDWAVEEFVTKDNKRCVLGHCGVTDDADVLTVEAIVLSRLIYSNFDVLTVDINDGNRNDTEYLGNTPKKRILAALELITAGVSI